MDEHITHAVRLMCDAAHEMRRQHELQTVLIDRLCVVADALVEMAEGEQPSGASRLPRAAVSS